MDNDNLYSSDRFSGDVLDFVYKNGIAFLEQTRLSNKVVANKSLLLLSYLTLATGLILNHLLGFIRLDIYADVDVIAIIMLGVLAIYYTGIIFWVIYIARPRDVQIGYNRPKYLLSKQYLDLDKYNLSEIEHLKYMKYYCCIDIHEDIKTNISNISKRKQQFESALACALIFPAIVKLMKKISCLIPR